jgi:peptidoglycan-associated lipoprotein
MNKRHLLHIAILGTAALVLAACGSTPPKDGAGAPIEDRALGQSPGSGGPTTGIAPGGSSSTIDLTNRKPAGGVPTELTQGLLKERSVFFDFDSDAIREEYRPMMQAHAGYLARNRSAKMLIQGNTDERGSREYNLALGQRRAEAMRKMLTLMGAQDAQIEAVSLGEEKPRKLGSTEEAYRENRRGDILYGGEM